MQKKCDLCQNSLGIIKFRYTEGHICKKCYQVVSRNFSETIIDKGFVEISERYQNQESVIGLEDGFQVTNRIGDFLLLDNRNKKFCLPYNRRNSKEYRMPEIYSYRSIKKVDLVSEPYYTIDELWEATKDKNSDKIIHSLSVLITLNTEQEVKKIPILQSPVRAKSFALKQSLTFTNRILVALEKIQNIDSHAS